MKILVYGVGAIGSLMTHFLCMAGNDVTVVAGSTFVAEQGSPGFLGGYNSIYRHMTKQQIISQNWKM